jgi:predicted alpha/beta-hydrolase family hydrolase
VSTASFSVEVDVPASPQGSSPNRKDRTTTALVYAAAEARATLVLGHGAGASQTHPWMVAIARALAERGIDVVTFNFLYTEVGRRVPDKNGMLESTWRSVLRAVRSRVTRREPTLFVGGKSMGGRIATQVLAGGEADVVGAVAGGVLLGYPLHPPGKPDVLRTAHLPKVGVPLLFVQGSRDAFGTPRELAPVIEGLSSGTRLFVVEGGDHSFSVPRSSGETRDGVLARVADEVARFIQNPSAGAAATGLTA